MSWQVSQSARFKNAEALPIPHPGFAITPFDTFEAE
jgi:hypothetical protein